MYVGVKRNVMLRTCDLSFIFLFGGTTLVWAMH